MTISDPEQLVEMIVDAVVRKLEGRGLAKTVTLREYAEIIGRTPQTVRNKLKAYNKDLFEMGVYPDKAGKYSLRDLNEVFELKEETKGSI